MLKNKSPARLFIGIDPGQSGGIAAIIYSPQTGRYQASASPMPETEADIWNMIKELIAPTNIAGDSIKAFIEQVHSMPGQGVSSTFKFGRNYGMLRAFLVAAEIPREEVTPRKWQKSLGVKPRDTTKIKRRVKSKGKVRIKLVDKESHDQFKNRLKAKAQELFPALKVTLKTADALLIAEYCRRKEMGLL